jgi:enamine deaminase RidA (YjgF/YER057c/UK114 family)
MSQAVIHGDTVYLAGQVGEPGASVAEQTRQALAQIDILLGEAGTDRANLLQATILLADMAGFAEMNDVWEAWVVPGHAPTRATAAARLVDPGYLVEIIVIAARA